MKNLKSASLKTILVTGLPGSGKSYFARHLSEKLIATYLTTDRIRNEMLDQKTYSKEEKKLVYAEMKLRMVEALKRKQSSVLDGTFYKTSLRQDFINTAGIYSDVYIIEVKADEDLIRKRINRTRTDSDADFTIYQKLKDEWEDIKSPHLTIPSTNNNLNEMLESAIHYIQYQNER